MSELAREREALSRVCVKTMRAKGLTFKTLADKIGVSPFITAAALLGQMALPKEAAAKAATALGLKEAEAFLTEIPYRGSLGIAIPTDPTIYRFYEIVQVYERDRL
jgi:cyanate lyase